MSARPLLLAAGLAGLAATALAQTPYEAAWSAIMSEMHMGMNIAPTGDADLDFAKGMIPHHQGAVEMAELLLEYGEDPELRALAETIIATQTEEIAQLEAWIAAREAASN